MKKSWIVIGGLAVAAMVVVSMLNGLVQLDQSVNFSYGQVQNVMQRQADLIPNLVETAKGYAGHENKALVGVTEARSRLSAVAKMKPEDLASNPELQKQLVEAQANMQKSMMELNAVREAYPQLQANSNFQTLMSELSGSQNRITVERRRNQLTVQDYNNAVLVFPRRIVASLAGYQPRPYFQASEAAQSAPQVKF